MGVSSVNEAGSTWGAAFRNKPIFFMSRKEMDACVDANGVIHKSRLKNVELREDTCTLSSNDTFRRPNTTYDVDFYNFTIPFPNFQRNYFGVEVYIDMPAGCDYDLTLYDEYGNQVGKAEWDGEGRKKLSVPNWDMDTKKYCLKVENGNGEEVSPNDFYRISFHVTDNKEHEKTDAVREAYGNLYSAYSRKDENWRDYLDRYNEVLRETEQNYIRELEQLQQKQFDSLPEEKKYKGGRTVEELLQDMAEGKELSEAEREYVKIFANLKDAEKAQQKAELKNDLTEDFVKDLEDRGVSREDIEGMRVRIRSNGDVAVDGIEDENIREQVQKLVREKYSDKMYRYYIGTADSVGNLPENAYQYAADVQEVKRYLKGVTGQDVSLQNLYMLPDGKIGGLPKKADNLINNTKDNVKVDQMRDALRNIIGNIGVSGDVGIPDFTSQFQFQHGAFSVVDSGFAVDMGALDGRLTPQSSGNMYSDMYKYGFKIVL